MLVGVGMSVLVDVGGGVNGVLEGRAVCEVVGVGVMVGVLVMVAV